MIDTSTGEIVLVNEQSLSTPDRILGYLADLDNALAETYDISDALEIKNKVDAVRFLTNKLDLDRSIQNRVVQSQARTSHKIGEILLVMPKQRPGEYQRLQDATVAPSYAEIGVEPTAAHRWQTLAKVPIARLETFMEKQAKNGEGNLTLGGVVAYARNVLNLDPMMSSESGEWYTTPDIIKAVLAVMGSIDLDPCSNSKERPSVPAAKHYTKDDDGLAQDWVGRVYCNPPYGDEIPHWIDKLNLEYLEGRTTQAILLAPSRTDTVWFRALKKYPRCFMWGRVKFNGNENGAPFPTMLVSVGCNLAKFKSVMGKLGDVYVRIA